MLSLQKYLSLKHIFEIFHLFLEHLMHVNFSVEVITEKIWKRSSGPIYKVIINDCPIVVGVENPHKFWMCRHPRRFIQTSRLISTTVRSATYR
jgi:arginyl-tRNA--protein-N-Asp/Glu arginylyltransferase